MRRSGQLQALDCGAPELIILSVNVRYGERRPAAQGREPTFKLLSGSKYRRCVPNRIRTGVTAVKGRCPRPLDDGDLEDSYDGRRPVGGGKRDRTADLLHAMQALSQLSYTPTQGAKL